MSDLDESQANLWIKRSLCPRRSQTVDRLVYAANHYPELNWVEILPPIGGGESRGENWTVLESLDRAVKRIRKGEMPPEFPWVAKSKKSPTVLKKVRLMTLPLTTLCEER